MNVIANLSSVVAEMNQRYVVWEEDLDLLVRSVVASCHMLIVGFPLRLDSAGTIP